MSSWIRYILLTTFAKHSPRTGYRLFDSRFSKALWQTLRPLIGPKNVCIFPVACPEYARYQLSYAPLHKAVVLIGLRLVICNPITALIRVVYFWLKKSA